MSFLPLARSSATLDYFRVIDGDLATSPRGSISDGLTRVVGMDLGLKETLFDEYLISDAAALLVALGLISLIVLIFTQSIFLTVATLSAVAFSLGQAYAVYTFVFGVDFFPFMNVLAAVIAIGVGTDDTFILVKTWTSHYRNKVHSCQIAGKYQKDLFRRLVWP